LRSKVVGLEFVWMSKGKTGIVRENGSNRFCGTEIVEVLRLPVDSLRSFGVAQDDTSVEKKE
jgi:hypothetical protein